MTTTGHKGRGSVGRTLKAEEIRIERRSKKLCVKCGKPNKDMNFMWCKTCRIKRWK